jgi:hypothetical protein
MDELTKRRLVHNEQLFREVNIEREQAHPDAGDRELTFICECSDQRCSGRIGLSAAAYQEIRRTPRCFLLLPGHEQPEIERVVEHHDGYEIVAKRAA